jgi:putative membrane protein
MIDRHEESINKFEKRMDKTEDPDLKAFITKTLPALRMHLEQLNSTHDKIKDTNT